MIKNCSNVRKFQFFEEINTPKQEESINNNQDIQEEDNESKSGNKKSDNDSNILLKNVTPGGTNQMQAIDGVIFICGKAIHKLNDKMIRESLIMKIVDQKVVDEYRIFNGVYYDFQIKNYNEKPLFIVTGGNFNEYVIEGKKQLFMATSIKIYDATPFIKDKNKRYPVPSGLKPTDEPYKKLLIKQIKLLKRLSDNQLVCDTEGDKMEGYESFQNIIAFAIDNSFTNCAIGLDKGDILLITGYPNLLECNSKEIKMKYLEKIIPKDREIHITNLAFSELALNNELNKILYASTANSLHYYVWKITNESNNKKNKQNESNIILKTLSGDGKGAYSGCLAVKDDLLLVASSNDDFIAEYENLDFGKTWFFDGKKNCVKYFNEYILFVVYGETTSSLQIYDRKNRFFVYFSMDTKKIIAVCFDDQYIYALIEESIDNKYIMTLKEKENKDKFDTFFHKNFYDTAATYAENLNYDKKKISDICKKHAEYEYEKGDFDKSIEQYIKTINYLEPSFVIQKFLEKSKLDYLIQYLEALEKDKDFRMRGQTELKDYTTLLLNCYIMQEKIPKLKEFIDNKNMSFPESIIKTAIDVCLETRNTDLALNIAKQKNLIEDYLQILILGLGKLKEALDYIEPSDSTEVANALSEKEGLISGNKNIGSLSSNNNNIRKNISTKEKINLFCKFGEYFLKADTSILEDFYQRVAGFIEKNKSKINREDMLRLIKIFVVSEKYFTFFFEKMLELNVDIDQYMIHRRIEFYLEEEVEKNNRQKIIEILKNDKFQKLCDFQYLTMLFKCKDFPEGIVTISEILQLKQELLFVYMDQKEYEKIINLCIDYGKGEQSFWGIALNYFVNPVIRENLIQEEREKIDKYFEIFLDKILESGCMLPVNVLDIIKSQNEEISVKFLKKFVNKALEQQMKPLLKSEKHFNENNEQLKQINEQINELDTKAFPICFSGPCECGVEITLPAVAFKCGHYYHSLCLNANINDEMKDLKCPKCKNEQNKLLEIIKQNKENYKKINSKQGLENALETSIDKREFINGLLSKGVFSLGPVDNERILEDYQRNKK